MIQGKSCQCRCYELVYIGKRPKYPHIFAPQSYNRIISLLNNTLHTIVVLRDSSRLFTTEAKERKLPLGAGDEIIKVDIVRTVKT